jgi:DivIVA domain-containing protein
VERPIFTPTRWREGYSRDEVDAAVARVMAGELSVDELRDLVFPPVRNGQGYDMGEVDDWLDGAMVARGGVPVTSPTPAVPAPAAEPDPAEQASADRLRAALIIVVTLAAAVWVYVSRF